MEHAIRYSASRLLIDSGFGTVSILFDCILRSEMGLQLHCVIVKNGKNGENEVSNFDLITRISFLTYWNLCNAKAKKLLCNSFFFKSASTAHRYKLINRLIVQGSCAYHRSGIHVSNEFLKHNSSSILLVSNLIFCKREAIEL